MAAYTIRVMSRDEMMLRTVAETAWETADRYMQRAWDAQTMSTVACCEAEYELLRGTHDAWYEKGMQAREVWSAVSGYLERENMRENERLLSAWRAEGLDEYDAQSRLFRHICYQVGRNW